MAEKKKMSVAEILAAARKADSAGGAQPPVAPAEPAESPAAAADAGDVETPKPAAAKPAAKPKAPGERPSVADILAQARGAKPAEAKPAPAKAEPKAKPAAEGKPAAAKPAAAKPAAKAGPKDTASILAAARADAKKPGPLSKAEAASLPAAKSPAKDAKGKASVAVPPMPARPAYVRPATTAPPVDEGRRGFLATMGATLFGSALAIGFTTMSATFGLWALGTARFMFPNILTEPPSRFKVGFPSNFAPGQVDTRFVAQFGVWIVNAEYNGKQQIFALRTVCTHLGCTPSWLEGEQKFKCPCHGSGFYKDGINFEGPAPRPLERYAIRPADDGQLEVDKSKLFQQELGQWENSDSFVNA
jgi:cytochrome b6-f complex iron-sulfur subunit